MRAEANCEVQCDEPKRTMCIFAKLSHSRDLNVLPEACSRDARNRHA